MSKPYPNRRRRRPGRRPPNHSSGRHGRQPQGFTPALIRPFYNVLMPGLRDPEKRVFFNQIPGWLITVFALGGAVIGYSLLGPLGVILGLGAGPAEIFEDYQGYLQADAASVFDRLYASGKIIEVGCMMHARRKFYEARTSDPPRGHQALAWIKLLYNVEREAKEKHEAEGYEAFVAARHALRGKRSRPIFKQLHDWLEAEAPKVLPKSPMGEAIQYALNHWTALERPLEAGFLELDNGACERAFKPVALGRKNWLFVGSDRGGETAAVLMSLCTTCKNLGIDPQVYLRDVLDRISTHPARRIEELLPDRWQALRQAGVAATD